MVSLVGEVVQVGRVCGVVVLALLRGPQWLRRLDEDEFRAVEVVVATEAIRRIKVGMEERKRGGLREAVAQARGGRGVPTPMRGGA